MDFEDEDRRKPSAESQAKGSTSVLATTRILFIQNQEQHFGHHYDCDIDKKEHVHMHYPGIGSSRVKSQTLDCSTLALKHYNKEKVKTKHIFFLVENNRRGSYIVIPFLCRENLIVLIYSSQWIAMLFIWSFPRRPSGMSMSIFGHSAIAAQECYSLLSCKENMGLMWLGKLP